jgi:heme o synthase
MRVMSDTILQLKQSWPRSFGLRSRDRVRDYALLMKPRVMSLVVFTGFVGLMLAPGTIDPYTATVTIICIAFGAGASGAINMWYDRDIDAHMTRTMNRPLPAGRVTPLETICLGVAFSIASVVTMSLLVNAMAGVLLAVTIAFYVFVYTIWLKRRTPQNIVIGGASGAFPPMIGWAAVTGGVDWGALSLFMVIFMWTPPHFWALSLFRSDDYERVNVPMLPVVAGQRETKRQMLIYTILLFPTALAPAVFGAASVMYAVIAAGLGAQFIGHAVKVWRDDSTETARAMFFFSIRYLFLIFVTLAADNWLSRFF